MDRDEGVRLRLRREEDRARREGHQGRDPRAFAGRQGADPGRRRDHGMGFARDPRVPGRERNRKLWPADPAERAARPLARGRDAFGLPEPAQAHEHEHAQALPGKGRTPESLAEIERIEAIWNARRRRPFLFGTFTAADAMYAPVVLRFRTYEVELPRAARSYCDAMLALPAMQRMDRGRGARDRVDPAARPVRVKAYVVGGAVRDELLGLPVKDRDYVVVGATPEEMVAPRLQARRQGLPGVPASRRRTRNTRSRAPSARAAAATTASRSTPRPTSRSRRTCGGATSRSTRWPRPTDGGADRSVRRQAGPARRACCAT